MVLAGDRPGQVVARVSGDGVDDGVRVPDPGCSDMAFQEHGTDGHGEQVGNDVFHGVGIGGGEGHWCRPLVVHLVKALVEEPVVQQRMGVVEGHLANQQEHGELPQDCAQRWKRPQAVFTLWAIHAESDEVAKMTGYQAHHQIVEEHLPDHVIVLHPVDGLIGSLLSFVFPQSLGRQCHIHDGVEPRIGKVKDSGQYVCGKDPVNVRIGTISGKNVIPNIL